MSLFLFKKEVERIELKNTLYGFSNTFIYTNAAMTNRAPGWNTGDGVIRKNDNEIAFNRLTAGTTYYIKSFENGSTTQFQTLTVTTFLSATGTWAELKNYDTTIYALSIRDTINNAIRDIDSYINIEGTTLTLTTRKLSMMQVVNNINKPLLSMMQYNNKFYPIITDSIANMVAGADVLQNLQYQFTIVDNVSNFLSSWQQIQGLPNPSNTTVIVTDTIRNLRASVASQVTSIFGQLNASSKHVAFNDTIQNYKSSTSYASISTTTNTISDSVSNITSSSNSQWLSDRVGVFFVNVLGDTLTVNSSNVVTLKTGAADLAKDRIAIITIKDTVQNIYSNLGMIATYGCDAFISDLAASIVAEAVHINANTNYITGITPTDRSLTEAENANFTFANFIQYTAPPVSNICFVKDTAVFSDQGWVAIQDLNETYTFGGYPLVALTKTVSPEEHLVEFEANCFAPSMPLRKVTCTMNHCILVNGKMKKAKDCAEGKFVPYTGEPLYNILLDVHSVVNVEGIACETLHPSNSIAHLFCHKLTDTAIEEWNRYAVENKVF